MFRIKVTAWARRTERGSILLIGVISLAAMTAIMASSLNRTVSVSKTVQDAKGAATESEIKRSILNLVMLELKNYAWTSGQTVGDLLPSDSNRFKSWYANVYENISYSVSVGDNSDEDGTQDYTSDSDGKVYVRIALDFPNRSTTTQILMSPGSPASGGGGEGPGGYPGSIGICYGFLNFITVLSMNASSSISGHDTLPNGWTGCSTSGGCPVGGGTSDQFGLATTSWLGTWSLGSYFDWGSHNHQGEVIGKPGNLIGGLPPPNNTSFGRPTTQDCENYDKIQTLADNMWAANDPSINKYQKNWGTMTVNGNLSFGTEASPEVVYIKTGILGKVRFSGTVSGVGILIADGNVDFDKSVNWYGVVINDANAIGNIMTFKEATNVYGAMLINRPILSAEIGSASMDFRFGAGTEADLVYSSPIIHSVLEGLDPNYVPPAGVDPGKGFSIASIQDL